MSLVQLQRVYTKDTFFPEWTKCLLSWKNCENCEYSVDDEDKYFCRIGSFVSITNISKLYRKFKDYERYRICR